MAVKIKFDTTHNVIQPTFVLSRRNGKKLGKLPVYNLVFKDGMNTFSELSFRVNKVDCVPNKERIEITHINPINISNTISTMTGFTRIGTLTEAKHTELLTYFKVNNKLLNVRLRFVQNGSPIIFTSPSFSWDDDYSNIYLSEETGTTKLIKVDRDGNVYINNAQSLGLVQDIACFVDFSFDVPISLIRNEFWEQITDFKLIWVKEWDMWFEMYVSLDESDETIKNISAKALGEAELSQINLYDIEINTETDIDRDDYVPTVLFDESKQNASLLHRITEKCPHYNFIHVDGSIAGIQRTYTFDNITVYDAFQEIAKEIDCIFIIKCHTGANGEIIRDISVYDLESYCTDCGERGNFLKQCTKCGSENVLQGYGDDTTIFVSTNNLANEISYSTDNGSVKNCFKLEAGDDLLTATITNCNPNGSGYIWYIPDETKSDMSRDLVNKLEDYDEDYEYYQNNYIATIPTDIVSNYNELISKYRAYTEEHQQINPTITGYPAIMKAYYDTVDFYYYLKDSLMPDIDVTHTTAALEAAKLNSINLSPVAVLNLTSSTSSATATSAIISMARTLVNNNYQVKVSNPDTTFVDNVWSGIFIVTNYADDEDTYTTQRISVQINGDYEKYTKQRIEKTLANSVKENKYGIIELFSLNETNFKLELRKYSLERLRSFHDSCQSCLDILIQQGIADKNSWANKDPDLYRELYLPYYNKLHYIEDEMDIRQSEIDIVIGKFDEYGEIVTQGMQTIIESEKNMIQDILNFEKYLGTDLWLEFVAYRREDTYENMNFISDGLNNQELFEKALEFIDVARKDIFKSATLQHSISASLKNLLVMKEFEPIVDYFEVGNWIRVKVDDKIYRLRLLDYEIDFDNLENISIKFSDVNIVSDGFSDVESVLNQAASIATSYGEVSRQAKQGKKSNDQLNEWVSKGLALTKMKIVDSADNQDISWDNHGFLCREYLPIIDDYDAKQLKIISKGLYVTDDNWESSRAGIGNFTFWNPKTQKVEESYGVIADTIIGNIILGEELGIYNRNNSIILDEDGLSVNDVDNHSSRALNDEEDCNRVMISTSEVNKYLIGESINIGTRRGRNDIATNRIIQSISTNGDNSYIVFSGSPVDMASDYYVSTNFTTIQINPNNGDGLFTIGTSLNGNIMKVDENGNGYYYGQMNVANGAFKVLSDGSLNIGNGNFVVDAEGNVTAKKGSFKGDITGATGTFSGQLNVNNNFIVDSTGNVNMNGNITLGGNITWSSSNSPVQCQYSSNGSSWHTSFYSSDYYARYSYDGGITWTSAIQIRGINGRDGEDGRDGYDGTDATVTWHSIYSALYSNAVDGIYASGGDICICATYIKAGYIDCESIRLESGSAGFSEGRGSTGVRTTYGGMIYAGSSYHNYAPYILVTDAGCRMTASDTVGVMDFYLIESGIHASEEIQVSSDRRIKNSIDYDLDKYENFFMALKPSTFKYNKGASGRKHTGFIAQDVEDALLNNDLTTDEFAGLTIQTYQDGDDPIQDTDNNFYRLRYGEFISLNTYMIQKLYRKIERLENELKEYKKEEN